MKKRTRNNLATFLGWSTTIVTALALIDFDTLDYNSVNTYVKLAVTLLPAIGGHLSEVKGKE
jgi:hypothetical protein